MAYSPTLDSTNALVTLDQVKTSLGIDIGSAQVLYVTVDGQSEGALAGKYFLFATTLTEYYVWYDVAADPTDPAVSGKTGVEIDISTGASATTVATATAAAITLLTGVTATASGNTVVITNSTAGQVEKPTTGTCTTFVLTIQTEGRIADLSADNILIDEINAVSLAFKRETHRVLVSQSLTEYYDGPGGVVLYLRNPPVASLTLYQDTARAWATATLIAATDYSLYAEEGRIYLTGTTFLRDQYVIKAAYTGGYTTVPHDLQRAAMEWVTQRYELNDHHAYSTDSRSNDKGGTTRYLHTQLGSVKQALLDYTRTVVM
jgi:hypothetical protein